ncbi:MAG: hypothetical protein ACPG5B_13915 [Chitinophagales bacterium]
MEVYSEKKFKPIWKVMVSTLFAIVGTIVRNVFNFYQVSCTTVKVI